MNRRVFGLCLVTLVVCAALSLLFLKVSFVAYPASIQAQSIEQLIRILFSVGGAVLGLVMTVFFYSLIFFRRRAGETGDGAPLTGNTPLELVWTLVPLAIVLVLGVYGAIVLQDIEAPPSNTRESKVNVTAFQWGWQFDYPDYNVRSSELHLLVDQSVLLSMQSKDVIHDFWVPEFGPKMDIVPGMTTELRFTPITDGKYTVVCSELCGVGHTYMTAPVYVTSAADFQTWVSQQQKGTPIPTVTATPGPATTYAARAQLGKDVFTSSCAVCHGSNGQGGVGPAVLGGAQHLTKYKTAADLLKFISASMPLNKPGSLTHQQYVDVLAFLLVQNNEVAASSNFDETQLSGVALK